MERFYDDLYLQIMLHGGDPDKESKDATTKEEAERLIDDPFGDFPHDVDYSVFNPEDVSRMVNKDEARIAKAKASGVELPKEVIWRLWTRERMDSLFGDDPLKKRASVNSNLWFLYNQMCHRGYQPKMEDIKQCVKISYAAYLIQPNSGDMRQRKSLEKKRGLPKCKFRLGDSNVPVWHTANLVREGRLDRLVARLDVACGFPIVGLPNAEKFDG